MPNNFIGQTYNSWTILGRKTCHIYTCQCVCGKIKDRDIYTIIKGQSKSCSCGRRKNGKSPYKVSFSAYKNQAKARGYVFELDFNTFQNLVDNTCYYCGALPKNGIDRVDNTQGYILENCVTCCKICNIAKRDLPQEEFLSWVTRLYNYQRKSIKGTV